jgi:hypothetical protein
MAQIHSEREANREIGGSDQQGEEEERHAIAFARVETRAILTATLQSAQPLEPVGQGNTVHWQV